MSTQNCMIILMGPDGSTSRHRPGCQAMHTLLNLGWQVARIFRPTAAEEADFNTWARTTGTQCGHPLTTCHTNRCFRPNGLTSRDLSELEAALTATERLRMTL